MDQREQYDYIVKELRIRNYIISCRNLEYLKTQIGKTDIDLRLNTEATPEMIRGMQLDALIIAVGALPAKPPISGIDSPNVMGFYEAIGHEERIGQNVVIIGGAVEECVGKIFMQSNG